MTAIELDQPAPQPNDRPAVWDLVLQDMALRDKVGRERYGTPLALQYFELSQAGENGVAFLIGLKAMNLIPAERAPR